MLHIGARDREGLVRNTDEYIQRALNQVLAPDGDIAVQDLVEHFRTRHQPFLRYSSIFQEPLRVRLVRMRRSDQIHGDVGVDEDHLRYPDPTPPR